MRSAGSAEHAWFRGLAVDPPQRGCTARSHSAAPLPPMAMAMAVGRQLCRICLSTNGTLIRHKKPSCACRATVGFTVTGQVRHGVLISACRCRSVWEDALPEVRCAERSQVCRCLPRRPGPHRLHWCRLLCSVWLPIAVRTDAVCYRQRVTAMRSCACNVGSQR